MSFPPTSYTGSPGRASELLKSSSVSHAKYPFSSSRIKIEENDSLDLDDEEDSPSEDNIIEKDQKKDPKAVDGKPPYSYVAMIGKCLMILILANII